MKLLATARAALLAVGAASLFLTSTAHAGGVIINPIGIGTQPGPVIPHSDGCVAAQTAAMNGKAYTDAAHCVTTVSVGSADISFDKNGLPAYVTVIDAQGIGHHYEQTTTKWDSQYTNSGYTLWRGPITEADTYYYESPAPSRIILRNPAATDKYINGRLYSLKGAIHTRNDTAQRFYRLIESVYVNGATYDDYCGFYFKPAESTGAFVQGPLVPLHSALMVHFDGAGTRHEKGMWGGGARTPVTCGSYLPAAMPNLNVYNDVSLRFVQGTRLQANLRALAWQFGVDYDADPLGLFEAAHARRIGMGKINLLALTDQQKNDLWLIGQATLAGAGAAAGVAIPGLVTGPVDIPLTALAFWMAFDMYLVDKKMEEQKTPPPPPPPNTPQSLLEDDLDDDDVEALAFDDESAASGVNSDGTTDESGGADDGAGDYEGGGCDAPGAACVPTDESARKRLPPVGLTSRVAP